MGVSPDAPQAVTVLPPPLSPERAVVRHPQLESWRGEGIYDNHPVGVSYDLGVGRWAVFNQDSTPMPDGAAFNVHVDHRRPSRWSSGCR